MLFVKSVLNGEPYVEPASDEKPSVEWNFERDSIFAEIKAVPGETPVLLSAPSINKFRNVQADDLECMCYGSQLHRGVV